MKKETTLKILWAIVLANSVWLLGSFLVYLGYTIVESGWAAVLTMVQIFMVICGITLIALMESK